MNSTNLPTTNLAIQLCHALLDSQVALESCQCEMVCASDLNSEFKVKMVHNHAPHAVGVYTSLMEEILMLSAGARGLAVKIAEFEVCHISGKFAPNCIIKVEFQPMVEMTSLFQCQLYDDDKLLFSAQGTVELS